MPDAFELLRKSYSSPNRSSAVEVWIDNNAPALPHFPSSGSHTLREIPTNLANPNPVEPYTLRSRLKSRARRARRIMAENDHEVAVKRGRGRPRGSGGRSGRGKAGDPPRVAGTIDKTKAVPDEGILEAGDPIGDFAPPLVLRPVESSSSQSRTSPTRSAGRSKAPAAVVKKGQLASMTPAIRFVNHDTATERGGLPPTVEGLWANHLFPADRLNALFDTPRKSKLGLRSDSFDTVDIFDKADLDLIWTTLSDVTSMADQYRNTAPESHWIGTVVAPLLHLVRRLNLFKDAGGRPLLEVLDMTTTEISPQSLCAYSEDPTLFKDVDKRIDYAIGLRLSAQERDLLERGQFAENYPTSINQTANFANLTPLFIHVEVKRRHVAKDPTIQLAAWIAAEFNKRKIEGYSLDMPVVLVAVDGDLWEIHVAYVENPSTVDDYRLNLLGVFDMGHTKTYLAGLRIVYILCCLARWGLGGYREWVDREILDKYRSVSYRAPQ